MGTLCLARPCSAQLIINEIQQSNIGTLFDDWYEIPDSWVELYNPTDVTVNTAGYRIGTTSSPTQAWRLPSLQILAGGRLIVYCDKEAEGLHADFRLESSQPGELHLFLFTSPVDSWRNIPAQLSPGVAYGRKTDGAEEVGFLLTPTPDAPNCGKIIRDILPRPIFSIAGNVRTTPTPQRLALSLPTGYEDAEIRFTTDGSTPADTSLLYEQPITINKSTVIRARTFRPGELPSATATESYIYHPRELTMPLVSLVIDPPYLYDDTIGISVDGTLEPGYPNWRRNWRRPLNLEFFEPDEQVSSINQLCEIRHGGGQRTRELSDFRSYALYAHKRFGNKRFRHEFFPEDKPGITEFKSLFLRNSGNDVGLLQFRDAAIQRSVARNVDLDWQGYRPVITYLNGEYYGMHNLRERSNEANVFANHNKLENIDLIEGWKSANEGDLTAFRHFQDFYAEDGHTLEEFESVMDVGEFMNLMIANMYFANIDFPGGNIRQWRERSENARWRWIMYDTDVGLGLYWGRHDFPVYDFLHAQGDFETFPTNPDYSTLLWRKLMACPEGRDMWIDRFAVYMGDFLNARHFCPLADRMSAHIDAEFRATAEKWGFNYERHLQELAFVQQWVTERTPAVYAEMATHFGLGQPRLLSIDARDAPQGFMVQGIPVKNAYVDGMWFEQRPLRIASDDPELLYWEITTTDDEGNRTTTYAQDKNLTIDIPLAHSLRITACTEHHTGIHLDSVQHGLSIHSHADRIIINSPAQKTMPIHDCAGKLVRTLTMQQGRNVYGGFPAGIYVIDGQKVRVTGH